MNLNNDQRLTISVVIPVYNAKDTLAQCLKAVVSSNYPLFECIVVDDGSQDDSPAIANRFPVEFYQLKNGPTGPAHARNFGAERATGELLIFIDADVVLYPDTLEKVAAKFQASPEYDALFGSYDESPGDGGFISQYKNLTHHFVHQQANSEAETFWSGCGAIRRTVFIEAGGFDARRFVNPSIEDIELGARLKSQGRRIVVKKDVEVKHLKRWNFKGLVKTDIFNRAIPWTQLIIQEHNLPNTLNLKISQRISALLTFGLLLFLGWNIRQASLFLLLYTTVIFLFTVGLWDWREGVTKFRTNSKNNLRMVGLAGIMAIAAYYLKFPQLIPALGLLAIMTCVAPRLPRRQPDLLKAAFLAMIGLNITMALFLLIQMPYAISLPVMALTAAIVGLNSDLYRFYTRTRGLIFTAAALPFQLFYYIYSTAAFVYAGASHYWRKIWKPKNAVVSSPAPRLSENN